MKHRHTRALSLPEWLKGAGASVLSFALSTSAVAQTARCVRVTVHLEQEAVTSRSAFRASLTLKNESAGPVTSLFATPDIRNFQGEVSNANFGIAEPQVIGMTSVNGTGTLAPGAEGTATWLIVPRDEAAPTEPTIYGFGGTLQYVANGTTLTIPMEQVRLTVLPNPRLQPKYFWEKYVYSDDPFTSTVEPSQPFTVALMMSNVGAGSARNMRITTSQPRIVRNDDQLVVGFQLLGTQIDNRSVAGALQLDLGDIGPGQRRIVQHRMTSSLQGRFISFAAGYQHLSDLGGVVSSLIDEGYPKIFELHHVVQAAVEGGDLLPDFLTNEVHFPQDPNESDTDPARFDVPDHVHLSDGTVETVDAVLGATVEATGQSGAQITTVAGGSGWRYLVVADPYGGTRRINSVLRADGTRVAPENIWQTDRVFQAAGNTVLPIHRLHLFDRSTTSMYSVEFGPAGAVPAPVIVSQPVSRSVCIGQTTEFRVEASGQGSLVFQWQRNGVAIPGAQSDRLVLSSPGLNDVASYVCMVSNAGGSVSSQPASLSVSAGPTLGEQPRAVSVCSGSDAAFSTGVASGSAPFSYQWYRVDAQGTHPVTNIPARVSGAQTPMLVLSNTGDEDAGAYRCQVSDACGSTMSGDAPLILDSVTQFVLQPESRTACRSETLGLEVVATGRPPLRYQWMKLEGASWVSVVSDGVRWSGAQTSVLTCLGGVLDTSGQYRCEVTSGCGSATSQPATVERSAATEFVVQPSSVATCPGSVVVLSSLARGQGTAEYQWSRLTQTGWQNLGTDDPRISGARTEQLTIVDTSELDAGRYRCVFQSECGTVTSDEALVDVASAPCSGLVLHHTFDNCVPSDRSGLGNDLLLEGEPECILGVYGNAFHFDGMDDGCRVPNAASLNPTHGLTVVAWFRPETPFGGGNNAIVSKAAGPNFESPYYQFHLGITGDVPESMGPRGFSFAVQTDGGRGIPATAQANSPFNLWQPNHWYLLVGRYDGAAVTLTVYDDGGGVYQSEPAPLTGVMHDSGEDLLLGATSSLPNIRPPGSIDEVRLYDRAISEAEAQLLYQSPGGMPVVTVQDGASCATKILSSQFAISTCQTLQWRRNGEPLEDSANHVSGSRTPTLVIDRRVPSDAGDYDLVIVSPCGEMVSNKVTIPIESCGGLVLHHTFDNCVPSDRSGLGNDLLLEGEPECILGVYGNAFHFDGMDDGCRVPNAPSLNPTHGLTVVAWFKPEIPFGGGNNAIVSKAAGPNFESPFYQYHLGVTGDVPASSGPRGFSFAVQTDGGRGIPATAQANSPFNLWQPNQWYLLVGRYDGTAVTLTVYDGSGGVYQSEPAPLTGVMHDSGEDLLLGATSSLPNVRPPGSIDEVRLYDRAISEAEAQLLYRSPGGTPTISLVEGSACDMVDLTSQYTAGACQAFQWRRNGVPLVDLAGRISGSNMPTLHILQRTAADAGTYDLEVVTPCGVSVSNSIELSPCSGLVLHQTFDNCVPTDRSGLGNDLVLEGDPACIPGVFGNALRFDASDDGCRIPNAASLNPGREMTVIAWFRPEVPYGGGNNAVVSKSAGQQFEFPFYQYHLGVTGDLLPEMGPRGFSFAVQTDGGIGIPTTAQANSPFYLWEAGHWYLLVGRYDGAAVTLTVIDDSGTVHQSVPQSLSGVMHDSGEDLCLGFTSSLPAARPPGSIDEVRIYDRALSDEEVRHLYDSPGGQPRARVESGGWLGYDAVLTASRLAAACESLQWFKDGEPLTDEPGHVEGATTETLTFVTVEAVDAAAYHLEVTTPCGTMVSEPVSLYVCFADFNQDGGVDGSDIGAFFGMWEAGDGSADCNRDGGVDGADVDCFFGYWENGC